MKYKLKTKIRAIIQSYNTRIASHLSFHFSIPEEEILQHINGMKENKRFKEIK